MNACNMAPPCTSPVGRDRTAANFVRHTMNKFLKRRGPPEPLASNGDALHALSAPPPPPQLSPPLKKSSTARWRKSRKTVEERPEINLDLALPSNDDFRTSLFMPALSARFSMLREQDDPTSKLGKASDDSVLHPRRRSRMDLVLDDIAEVEVSSTKSSVRPPFSDLRQHSYVSEEGYGSERDSSYNGNVMNRARPGEGNTMFGGRQRVYMIPNSASASSRSLGRVVYEDDLGTSLFQQYRRQRKEQAGRESDGSHGFDFGLDHVEPADQDDGDLAFPNDSAKDLSHSPSFSSSGQKRSTDSTSPSEARSSTAATSVNSQPATTATSPAKPSLQLQQPPSSAPSSAPASAQPLKRADTKMRRLYEQGLDQHMHEQQSSALNRLNSIHRQRTLSNKQPTMYLHGAKSASNLHDKMRQPVYALPSHEAPSTISLFSPFGPSGLSNSASPSPVASAPGTPITSQTAPDFDENFALLQALEPADRGKATAMGAFNKPKQSFDEQQYLERQRQLQRSTSTTAVRKDSETLAGTQAQHDGTQNFLPAPVSCAPTPPPSRVPLRDQEARNAQALFQKAARQMAAPAGPLRSDGGNLPDQHRTFFGTSSSESEEEDDTQRPGPPSSLKMPDYGYGTQHGKWQPTVLPAVSEHPALRSQNSKATAAGAEDGTRSQATRPTPTANFSRPEPPRIQTSEEEEIESPTLGNNGPSGALNGLMQHLRQKSNVSSITQRSDGTSFVEATGPAELTATNLDLVNRPIQSIAYSESRVGSYAISNPWDLEDVDTTSRAERRGSRASVSPIEGDHLAAPFDSYSSSLSHRHSAVSALEPEAEKEDAPQSDSQPQHNRDTSTATEQDREAFDNELAARRLAIQENIRKSKAERENRSRGISPARSSSSGRKAFSDVMPTAPPKAPKLLSGDAASNNGATAAGATHRETGTPVSEFSRPRDRSGSRPSVRNEQLRASQRSETEAVRQVQQSRSRENSESHPLPPVNRSPPSSSAGQRSRANSGTTNGRSRSRTGPYRDDLEKAMAEGTGSSTASVPELSMLGPRELTPRSTPDVYQNPFEAPRARSGSRAAMTNYFDTALHNLQTGSKERLTPGAPSPALTPNLYSPIVSPAPRSPAASFAQNMTPPLSGNTTPLQSTFVPPPPIPPSSGRPGGVLRKRAVSKGDISEPTLISSTSNVELVNLPEGASLKNGMDEPPPVPPINPARRATKKILSLGRKESQDSTASQGRRSKTPDAGLRKSPDPELPFDMPQTYHSRSATLSPQKAGPKQSFDQLPAGTHNVYGPEQLERSSPPAAVPLDGAMF